LGIAAVAAGLGFATCFLGAAWKLINTVINAIQLITFFINIFICRYK
jgi:hypothetical protein